MSTDATKPDAPKPEAAAKPIAAKPDAPKPEAPRPGAAKPSIQQWLEERKKPVLAIAAVIACAVGYIIWTKTHHRPSEQFVKGNGRIEATEVDIATKYAGRIQDIFADEGDFVTKGQRLAVMDVKTLEAQHDEAVADRQQSLDKVAEATAEVALRESEVRARQAQVAARESDREAQLAVVRQRESELDAAQRRFARSETLAKEGASSQQELDDDRARTRGSEAAVSSATANVTATREAVAAARAQVTSAVSAVAAARAQVTAAQAQVEAKKATIRRIDADLADSVLKAPRDGRVQFRVAEPGEVLNAGGRVLNVVDLSDVYMTLFLPESAAGKVAIGAEARIVLDAAPALVIPARVSYVSSVAQFTPKTVETATERQKLMFRIKAQIDPRLLKRYLHQVKTGLPGVAWVRLDPNAEWPPDLTVPPELRVPGAEGP